MSGDGVQLGIGWAMGACGFWTGADFVAAQAFWVERGQWNLSLS
jgi:hypothetical protein